MDIRPSDPTFTATAVTPPASVPVLLGPTAVDEGRSPELIKDQKVVGTIGATSRYELVAGAPPIDAKVALAGDPLAGIPGILPASPSRETPVISQMGATDALPRLSTGLKASDFPKSSSIAGSSYGGAEAAGSGPSGSVSGSLASKIQKMRKGNRARKGRGRSTHPPIEGSKMDALEAKFGPWQGRGKNVDPRTGTGPQGNKFLNGAYDALSKGDYQTAGSLYEKAKKTGSPIMLDLDGNGRLGTTGVSTAKDRVDGQMGSTVQFDLDGDGRKESIEWMKGGDGMLVDDRDGGATAAMNGHGEIDGKRLFGDEGGKYGNGYDKLRQLDRDGDGKIAGAELEGLKVWIDNGDARVGGGELKSLADLGVTEISVQMKLETNERGEDLMRSSFTQNGQTRVSEDVWFAMQ